MQAPQAILLFLAIYATLGLLFAAAFLTIGIQRTDHAAKGAGVRFRLLILPGVVAFWPRLALKWLRCKGEHP